MLDMTLMCELQYGATQTLQIVPLVREWRQMEQGFSAVEALSATTRGRQRTEQ